MIGPYSVQQLQGTLAPNMPSNLKEIYRYTFWDSLSVAAANTPLIGQHTLFQTPVGSGTQTIFTTNFHGNAGQLPSGQWFAIMGIGVKSMVDLNLSDTTGAILNNALKCQKEAIEYGVMTIMLGSSKMVIDHVPLNKFGAGCGYTSAGWGSSNLTEAGDAAAGWQVLNNCVPIESAMYDLQAWPIIMAPVTNTAIIIDHGNGATGVVVPANTTVTITVFLDGYLYRPA
jgi:hypothetical protein